MIIDTSAIVRIITGEQDFAVYHQAICKATKPRMSAVSLFEASVVLLKLRGTAAVDAMLDYIAHTGVRIEPFEKLDATRATEAYKNFGKGLNKPGLNFGDCAVYALAALNHQPVLSTSTEFTEAELRSAL
jgi:ribonuclease VapC